MNTINAGRFALPGERSKPVRMRLAGRVVAQRVPVERAPKMYLHVVEADDAAPDGAPALALPAQIAV